MVGVCGPKMMLLGVLGSVINNQVCKIQFAKLASSLASPFADDDAMVLLLFSRRSREHDISVL